MMLYSTIVRRGIALVSAASMTVPVVAVGTFAQGVAAAPALPYCDAITVPEAKVEDSVHAFFNRTHTAPKNERHEDFVPHAKCLDTQGHEAEKFTHYKVNGTNLDETHTVVRIPDAAWYSNMYIDGGVLLALLGGVVFFKHMRAKGLKREQAREEEVRAKEARAREEGARMARSAGIDNTPRFLDASALNLPGTQAGQKMSVVGAIPASQIPPNATQIHYGGNTYITQVNPESQMVEAMLINQSIQNAMFWDMYWADRAWAPTLYESPYVYGPGGAIIVEPGYSAPIVLNDTVYGNTPVIENNFENSPDYSIDAQREIVAEGGVVESSETTTYRGDSNNAGDSKWGSDTGSGREQTFSDRAETSYSRNDSQQDTNNYGNNDGGSGGGGNDGGGFNDTSNSYTDTSSSFSDSGSSFSDNN